MQKQKMIKIEKATLYFCVFLILGIAISVQFRSVTEIINKNNSLKLQYEDIAAELIVEKKKAETLKSNLETKLYKRDQMIQQTLENRKGAEKLNEKWKYAMQLAGFYENKGAGIEITMNDAKESAENPKYSIIHDTDMLKIINELNVAGAKAISINGERWISSSEVICTGPTIRVNKNRYSTPFVIRAVGDPKRLAFALEDSFIVNEMRAFNIRIEIQKLDYLKIQKFSGKPTN